MKTLKRFVVAAALVVVGALGVPAGALAQLTIEASGVPDSGGDGNAIDAVGAVYA